MDGSSFDALAKAWSAGPSRRALLRGVAGGVGAGLLAALRVTPAATASSPRKRRARGARTATACVQYGRACGGDGQCCSENCIDGKCACAVGKTRCGTRCVDLRTNENHCGACDTPCPEDQQCRTGQCGCAQYGGACQGDATCCSKHCVGGACACPKGRTRCGTRCINTAYDNANCGECGNACPAGESCRDGTCAPCVPIGDRLPITCKAGGGRLCCPPHDVEGRPTHWNCDYDRNRCCVALGASCTQDAGCCGDRQDILCVDGFCRYHGTQACPGDEVACPAGVCAPAGAECCNKHGKYCADGASCCLGSETGCCQAGESCCDDGRSCCGEGMVCCPGTSDDPGFGCCLPS